MNKQTGTGGIGCLTVVGIMFFVLKLLAIEPVAHWSWIWVLSPFWIPFALGVGVLVAVFLIVFALGGRRP